MRITSITISLTDEEFIEIVDTAGYGIGSWASQAEVDEQAMTYTVTVAPGPRNPGPARTAHVLTRTSIEQAMAGLLSTPGSVSDAIRSNLMSSDLGDYDAQVCDCIVQFAIFDEVRYG